MIRERMRRGAKARGATIIAALATCAAFAVWPLQEMHIIAPVIAQPETAKKTVLALDLAAFRVPLWVAEPAPAPLPVIAPTPPPPPPIKLQLLAIIREADVYRAAVYDPDTDRILVVTAGEKIGSCSVDNVDQFSLTLRDDAGKRVLALRVAGVGDVGKVESP